jgi:hypothetical protein
MAGWVLRWLSAVRTRLRQRLDLLLEFIVLRHQLAVLQRTGTRRPCFRPSERLFWLFLSGWWANWQRSLIIVQPATVLRWRRRGLRAICLSGSCRRWRGGRPRINLEVGAPIVRISQESFLWGRAADPWRAAETRIRCLASHCVPLHAKARLSAYPDLAHHAAKPEGITDTQAAGIHEFCTTNHYRARKRPTISYNSIVPHVCHDQPAQKANDPQCPYPAPLPRGSSRGQGL